MDSGHGTVARVQQQDRQTVRGPDREQDAGPIRHQSVAHRQEMLRPPRGGKARGVIFNLSVRSQHHRVNMRRMGLPQAGKGEALHADLCEEALTVPLNVRTQVCFNDPQVQACHPTFAQTSAPSAEGMQQPGEARKRNALEPLQSPARDDLETAASQSANIA